MPLAMAVVVLEQNHVSALIQLDHLSPMIVAIAALVEMQMREVVLGQNLVLGLVFESEVQHDCRGCDSGLELGVHR